jgi:hypothetical protein
VYQSIPFDPGKIVHCAESALFEFLQINKIDSAPSESEITSSPSIQISPDIQLNQVNWNPPPVGRFKINFDAAFHMDSNQMGLCAIARDSSARVIDGISSLGVSSSALEAQAQAFLLSILQRDSRLSSLSSNQTPKFSLTVSTTYHLQFLGEFILLSRRSDSPPFCWIVQFGDGFPK